MEPSLKSRLLSQHHQNERINKKTFDSSKVFLFEFFLDKSALELQGCKTESDCQGKR